MGVFPGGAAIENLHEAVSDPLLGLLIFPGFVGGPGTGGGRRTSRPGQGFVLSTAQGRSALLRGGGAGTGCLGGMAMSQHGPACLWKALARSGATPALGDAPVLPCAEARKPPFCACTLEAFPRAAAPENLHTAVCGPLLGLPIFPAFVGGPGSGGGRGTSRPGQGFVLRTTRGRSALLQGG